MFYGLFIKDYISNDFVWYYIVKECICLCAPISFTYIVRLFEYWYEEFLHEFVLISYRCDLYINEFMNLCSPIYCDLVLSLMEHELGGPYKVLGVIVSGAVSGPNLFHNTSIFNSLSPYFTCMQNPDSRANPF